MYLRVKRIAEFPAMEEQFHMEFRQLRRRCIKVKGWWFKSRSYNLVSPPILSSAQKAGFLDLVTGSPCDTQSILPNVSHTSILPRNSRLSGIRKWRWASRTEISTASDSERCPLPFAFTCGPTYETTNSCTDWVRGASLNDSTQCSSRFLLMVSQ